MKEKTKKIERKCKEKNVNIFYRTIIKRNGKNCQYELISKERKQKRNGKKENGMKRNQKGMIFDFFSFLFAFFSFLFAFFSFLFAFFSFFLIVKNFPMTKKIIIRKRKNTQRKLNDNNESKR